MTVAELIELLKKYPQDAVVNIEYQPDSQYYQREWKSDLELYHNDFRNVVEIT